MPPRTPHRLPTEPPPPVMQALHKRFAGQDLPALDVVFALRMTAQQMDNAITEWMAGTAGTPARFQILVLLWASETSGVPHKEIVKALEVTRATVSGLMMGLERDGLVLREGSPDDRRAWILRLTPKGRRSFEAMANEHEQWVLELFEGVDAKAVQQLYTHLGALRVHLVRNDASTEDKA